MRSSILVTLAALASGVFSAAVMKRADVDHSKDGVYTAGGKVSSLGKRAEVDHSKDGVYTASGKVANVDKRGLHEVHSQLAARDNNIGCDDHVAVTPDDGAAARDALLLYCGAQDSNCNQTIWAKSGEAVVFFCRWRDAATWNPNSLTWALGQIQSQCANNQGGNVNDMDGEESKRTWSYGLTDWTRNDWCNYQAGFQE
ncbi:hypothetical protein TruAng_006756 [Truncatella angustata]|nr:hypothetical protein TruAng_006756 [Truncatella angustata]